jgi:hypothetical protein
MTNNSYLTQQMSAQAPNTSVNLSGLFPGNSGLQSVVNSLQSAQNAANQANQQRYQDILGMYSQMGQSGAQQIQQQTQQNQAQNTQNMIGSGLGNTTLTSAMSNQINAMGQSNLLNLQNTLTGEEASVMQSMNQNGPNIGQYAGLLQAAANKPQSMAGTVNYVSPFGSMNNGMNGSSVSSFGSMNNGMNGSSVSSFGGNTAVPSGSVSQPNALMQVQPGTVQNQQTSVLAGQGYDANGNLIQSGGDFSDSSGGDFSDSDIYS